MGNAMFHCMLRPILTVRLIQPNGEVLEFDRQVMAKQLMKLYHGHLVVHCSRLCRSEGGTRSVGLQGARVTLLRPEKMLLLGQTYCLLRVPSPTTHLQAGPAARSISPPANWRFIQRQICGRELRRVTLRGLIYGTASDVCVYEREIVGQLQRQFAQAIQLTFGPTYTSSTSAAAARKDSDHPRILARPERQAKASSLASSLASSTEISKSWKPRLEAIVESPTNNADVQVSGSRSIVTAPDAAPIVSSSACEGRRYPSIVQEASGES